MSVSIRTIPRAGLGLFLAGWLAACGAPAPTPTAAPLPTPVVVTQAPAASPAVPSEAAPTAEPSATAAAPTPAEPRLVELRGLAPQPIEAAFAVAQELGWVTASAQPFTPAAVAAVAQAGTEIVILNGAPGEGDFCALLEQLPAAYLIGVDTPVCDPAPANLLVLGGPESRQDQAGFLAGLAAGFATATERVAVFADATTPDGLKYRNGFLSGARYACPKCRLDTVDLDGTQAVDFAAAEAGKYVSLGADVLFAAAGPAGDAALRSAAAAGGWVIGSGGDVYITLFAAGAAAGADRVLTSVYLDYGAALAAALRAYAGGEQPAGRQPLALANGGVVLAPWRNAEAALSPLDLKDVEQTRLRLAERTLETGVDPVTGAER